MSDVGRERGNGRNISPRLYIVVGLILISIPIGGYGVILWRDAYRRRAEECFQRPLRTLLGQKSWIETAVFTPDGRYLLSGDYRAVRIWEVPAGREAGELPGPRDLAKAVAVSPDGRQVIAGDMKGLILLWDLGGRRKLQELTGHQGYVLSVAFSPDGKRALSGGNDGMVRLWNLENGRLLRKLAGHGHTVHCVAFTPDGRRAISGGSDHTLRVWDLERGAQTGTLGPRREIVKSVAFSQDGRLMLSVAWNGRCGVSRIWETEHWKEIRQFTGGSVAALSPDGKYVVIATDKYCSDAPMMQLRAVESGRLVREFLSPELHTGQWNGSVMVIGFSPDGRHLFSGCSWRKDPVTSLYHQDLFLWRLPDSFGYRLLGTQDKKK